MDFGTADDVVAEVRAKVLRRAQINVPSAKQRREFDLDPRQPRQSRRPPGLEFHQQALPALPGLAQPHLPC